MTSRKAHWEGVYKSVDPAQVNWYQSDPALSLELIGSVSTPESTILDVGGGGSLLVDRLIREGYRNISVLDVSATALGNARQRLGEAASQVEWIESDATLFRSNKVIDVWHDRAVFHFLRDRDDRTAYVETVSHAVGLGGHVVISTFALNGPNRCAGLDTEQYGPEEMCEVFGSNFELIRSETEEHMTPGQTIQQFWYGVFRRIT